MNISSPSISVSGAPLIHFLGDPKMLKEFGSGKEFRDQLEPILTESGLTGEFIVLVDQKIKGTAHTCGFKLGMPNSHRRSVEIRWQPGGNDTRFSLQLNSPHGMEAIDLHSLLDKAIKKKEELNKQEVKPQESGVLVEDRQEEVQAQLDSDEVELFLQELVPIATAAGVVTREACLNALSQLGRVDAESDLVVLLGLGCLQRASTKAFLRISAASLERFRKESGPSVSVVELASENQEVASPVDAIVQHDSSVPLLAEAGKFLEVVLKAREQRVSLLKLRQEASGIQSQIEGLKDNLATLMSEIEEIEASLTNPDVEKAEQSIASLQKMLSSF